MKAAAIRAIRTLLQNCLAVLTVFFLAIKGDGTLANIKAHGAVLLYGFVLAGVGALISFLQNLIEQRTNANVPRG